MFYTYICVKVLVGNLFFSCYKQFNFTRWSKTRRRISRISLHICGIKLFTTRRTSPNKHFFVLIFVPCLERKFVQIVCKFNKFNQQFDFDLKRIVSSLNFYLFEYLKFSIRANDYILFIAKKKLDIILISSEIKGWILLWNEDIHILYKYIALVESYLLRTSFDSC